MTNKTKLAVISTTAAAVPLSFIQSPYPEELVLQHVPTLLGLVVFAIVVVIVKPSALTFACVLAFFWIHILGARWIYSFVPYDHVLRSIAGTTTLELFGWQRNHYDRFVHFSSGLLGVPPVSEILQRWGGMRSLGAAIMSISAVLAIGSLYEIFEWQLAVTLAPNHAEAYNGQQGDIWDPQKDLALAAFGAVISAILVSRWIPPSIERTVA